MLSLVAQGHPKKRTARQLGIAERTVKLHVTALLDTLGARNRTQPHASARRRTRQRGAVVSAVMSAERGAIAEDHASSLALMDLSDPPG